MKEYPIESEYLQENMTIKVYFPEAFSPLNTYNLCIMQDGEDYFQLGRVASVSDQLHEKAEITNTVFAGLHYQDKFDRREKYHPDGKQNQAYTHFLIREVIPFLDDLIPTSQMGQSRTLMGDSLAGTLALMTALRYPNTIGNVIMQSPYVDENVLNTVKHSAEIRTLEIYHTIGTEETVVHTTEGTKEDFLTPNRKLNRLLQTLNTNFYIYHELEGPHTWKPWQKDLKRALGTMFAE